MNTVIKQLAICLIAAVVVSGQAAADKPDSPGNSSKQKSVQGDGSSSAYQYKDEYPHSYFNDDRITRIGNYYSKSRGSGNCPPGLAKKNNGCQPPGQVKKWHRGELLPPDLVYYDLPSALLAELGRTPDGQKVVRAGTAVLLINIATGMVLDALELQD